MAKGNNVKGARALDMRVAPEDRPGWVMGSERLLRVGEPVYCAGGDGAVRAIFGKTGDGSRLIEIRLEDEKAKPFFAAASNVLVAPS